MGRIKVYEGKKITVSFDAGKCIHSRNCVLGLPGVFRANFEGEWIDPNGAPFEAVAALIERCPSGALTYCLTKSDRKERQPEVNVVRTLENGPLAASAQLVISGEEPGYRSTLCRCGASKNKPFCDGSHKEVAFKATGEPAAGKCDSLEKRDGPLTIIPLKDGPLMVEGNMELCSGTGRPLLRTTKTALCRCGASGNKPFCDGSHQKTGFKAD